MVDKTPSDFLKSPSDYVNHLFWLSYILKFGSKEIKNRHCEVCDVTCRVGFQNKMRTFGGQFFSSGVNATRAHNRHLKVTFR